MTQICMAAMSFFYPGTGRSVFNGLSLLWNFESGNVIAVMGPSGVGKTTLLKLIAGIERPSNGELRIDKENPFFALMSQAPVLFEHLSIRENAEIFSVLDSTRRRFDGDLFHRAAVVLRIDTLLGRRGPVYELSGGERQRLALLRALSVRPDFLLLDEPCSGMDAEIKREFLISLRELLRHERVPTIYVTHHPDEVSIIADQVAYLINDDSGAVARCSTQLVSSFFSEPVTLRAALVVGYPSASILRIKKSGLDGADVQFVVGPENVILGSRDGLPFEVVTRNAVFAVLRVNGLDGTVIVRASDLDIGGGGSATKMKICGTVRVYDAVGNFLNVENCGSRREYGHEDFGQSFFP